MDNTGQTPPAIPAESSPSSASSLRAEPPERNYRHYVWQGKIGPAFWTITGVFSLLLNAVLIAVILLLGREIFTIKNLLGDQLLSGLAQNFALMDQAVIRSTVVVNDQIPVQFILPVSKKTTVVLTEDTMLSNARVDLATGGLSIINAPTNILLPAGTPLNIKLDMEIPVDAMIPVTLTVPVSIPLNQTELHEPFVGLQQVVHPYDSLLKELPVSWDEALCQENGSLLCGIIGGSHPASDP